MQTTGDGKTFSLFFCIEQLGILREKGYKTAAFTGTGSISGQFGLYKGFDLYNENEKFIKPVYEKSIRWIRENRDRTFFLFFHTYEVHGPFTNQYYVKKERVDENNIIEYRRACYDGHIRNMDSYINRFFNDLAQMNLLKKTLIIFTSDHGEDMGDRAPEWAKTRYAHGHNLYNEVLRVPLIFWGPSIDGNKRIDHQLRLIDLSPTILECLDYDAPDTFKGESLVSMMQGRNNESRMAFSEATTYGTEREGITYNGYKYVHRLSYGVLYDPQSTSMGLPLTPLHELYDLNKDPGETENIANQNEEIVAGYLGMIHDLFQDTSVDTEQFTPNDDIKNDPVLMKALKSLGYIK